MVEGMRIQKWLAQAGYGSRRSLETQIRLGQVRVNNQIATLGQRVLGKERIELHGQVVLPTKIVPRLLMYHKPVGQICTRVDKEQRPTVYTCLPPMTTGKWLLVGRLDIQTSGLLLVTNHGALAHYFMHPRGQFDREYIVKLSGHLTSNKIKALQSGLVLEGEFLKFKRLEVERTEADKVWCRVILQTGHYHEVRRLFASQKLLVMRLRRVRFGPYQLPRSLAPKHYRTLPIDRQLQQIVMAG